MSCRKELCKIRVDIMEYHGRNFVLHDFYKKALVFQLKNMRNRNAQLLFSRWHSRVEHKTRKQIPKVYCLIAFSGPYLFVSTALYRYPIWWAENCQSFLLWGAHKYPCEIWRSPLIFLFKNIMKIKY